MKYVIAAMSVVTTIAASAGAQVPATFVSESDCLKASPPCTCADAPSMEVYRDQQKKGRNAWAAVGATSPATTGAATAAFSAAFTSEPRVNAQFATCPGYNPAVNSLSKVAGVTNAGDTAYDPCLCAAFCKDIIQSTIDHESAHRPTLVLGFFSGVQQQIGCKVISALQPMCDSLDAQTLVASELISYSIGINTLDKAIDRIANGPDETQPAITCTWQPLPPVTLLEPTQAPLPSGFWQRLARLAERFWNGIAA